MRTMIEGAAGAVLIAWMVILGDVGAPPSDRVSGVDSASPLATPAIVATTAAPCPDPLAVVKAFLDANDAGRFDTSLAFLADDGTLVSWSEGVNGYHMRERHLTGKVEIRKALGEPGLRRTTGRPDDPIYKETAEKVSGNSVKFTLRPDRLRPNGKPYHPYQVEARLDGCKIKALTVIELVTWL